jgi:TPR repeat protein
MRLINKKGSVIAFYTWFTNYLKKHKTKKNIYLVIASLIIVTFLLAYQNSLSHRSTIATKNHLNAPQVNDLYFLDFRLIDKNLRPYEKYRLAKVVDITGDTITLLYSAFFYSKKVQIERAIQYGHLRYRDYFQGKRYDISKNDLIEMYQDNIIYMAKRPVNNKLYGNFISPDDHKKVQGSLYALGRTEYLTGKRILHAKTNEFSIEGAYEQFLTSAKLGYPQGQVALAELHLLENAKYYDLNQSLHWLLQASLQSYKPAILKYVIVCKKVPACQEVEFYKVLLAAGVNIKVKHIDVNLTAI